MKFEEGIAIIVFLCLLGLILIQSSKINDLEERVETIETDLACGGDDGK